MSGDSVMAAAAVVNTGLLTGIFYRLGWLGSTIEDVQGRVTRLESKADKVQA